MKEIKIKEKWIYEAMEKEMDRKYGIRLAISVLAEELKNCAEESTNIWGEIYKRYKLDRKKVYVYRKPSHVIRETFDRVTDPPWLRDKVT